MPQRLQPLLLVASLLWLGWLVMTFVHECGHIVGALCTGGTVQRVVWHPMVLSRTDLHPNPHPLIEVWAGPVVGGLLPLLVASLTTAFRLKSSYLFWVIAGFCLIANGLYIGIGAFDAVGDARELLALGTPRWLLAAFGCAAVGPGFWIWHRTSPKLGFGRSPSEIVPRHAYMTMALALLATLCGVMFGDPG